MTREDGNASVSAPDSGKRIDMHRLRAAHLTADRMTRKPIKANGAEAEMADAFGSMAALKNQGLLVPENHTHFRIERNFLISIMAKRIASIKFDEAWYLSKYPDVKDAVKRGIIASGREHYMAHGFYEHRMPTAIVVNEKWYLESYPDIAEAIRSGIYRSAQAHFDQAGFREGRLPFPNFQF
jgi:hypothetical protein